MDLFRSISDTIAGFIRRHKNTDPVNKNDILDLIDNNLIALRLVVSTCETEGGLFDYIEKNIFQANGSNKDNEALRKLYADYVANLKGPAQRLERTGFLKSIAGAAKIVLADHEAMRASFDKLFNDGTDESSIPLEQMKLSHATAFGFINLSSLFADWFCFLIGDIKGGTENVSRPPAYRINVVRDSGKTVAAFVTDVLLRGPSRGILSLVDTVRRAGDVAIYTDAATLDSYADINDYPGIRGFMQAFSVFQPILYLRESITSFTQQRYRRNIALRDWIQAKLVVLQMDAQRIPPESPDYQRQMQVVQRYSDELSRLDAAIARYEQS